MNEELHSFERVSCKEWRDVLYRLCDPDDEIKEVAFTDARTLIDSNTSLLADAADQIALLEIGLVHDFPVQRRHWDHSAHQIINALWQHPNDQYASVISDCYVNAASPAKLGSLVLLAVQSSEDAAIAFSHCIKSGGWPDQIYPRVFSELRQLLPYANHLFPDLIIHAGRQLPSITNLFVKAMIDKRLVPEDNLRARDHIVALVAENVEAAKAYQQPQSGSWMQDEKYWEVRTRLGAAIDIIGWIPGSDLEATKQALEFTDNQIKMFAMGALLRQGIEPESELLGELVATDAIRNNFFYMLNSQERMDLFPQEFFTLEAFAASELVEWLSYPSELGEPPEKLEMIAKIYGEQDGAKKIAYLWRFTTLEGKQYAGLSGGYDVQAEIRPVYGSHTFSSFNEWDSMTVEEHINSILETLSDWEKHSVKASPGMVS